MTRFLFFRRTCTYLKKLAISFILVTQMHLSKRTNHVLPSEGVSTQVEASLEHSNIGKELLLKDTSYNALKKLFVIKEDLDRLPGNSSLWSKKEQCILKHLVKSIECITDDELAAMISLLESEDDFEV
jgi:hypothetical protein